MRSPARHFRPLSVVIFLLALACTAPDPQAVQRPVTRSTSQALTSAFSEDFEAGLGSWTAVTTSGVATWHVVDHPELLSVSSALNPVAVTLADNGAHLAAAGGTHVAWFGNDDTGTYIGSDYPTPVASKGGGTSLEAQIGTLTSLAISLAGMTRAELEFDGWWELEGIAPPTTT